MALLHLSRPKNNAFMRSCRSGLLAQYSTAPLTMTRRAFRRARYSAKRFSSSCRVISTARSDEFSEVASDFDEGLRRSFSFSINVARAVPSSCRLDQKVSQEYSGLER